MSGPRLSYEELFTEIGKAWDTALNDNGLAITFLDKVKEEVQKREGEGERVDVLLELIEVSLQLFAKEDGGKLQESTSSRTTPSMRKRVTSNSDSQSSMDIRMHFMQARRRNGSGLPKNRSPGKM